MKILHDSVKMTTDFHCSFLIKYIPINDKKISQLYV